VPPWLDRVGVAEIPTVRRRSSNLAAAEIATVIPAFHTLRCQRASERQFTYAILDVPLRTYVHIFGANASAPIRN
jgi:hypothetical protein